MLIKALCEYYDILAKNGKVAQDGYSKQKISYFIELNVDGSIDRIIDCRKSEFIQKGKGKVREIKTDRVMYMPLPATNKSGIAANVADCRGAYIFGVAYTANEKDEQKRIKISKQAMQKHSKFVEVNLPFIEQMTQKSDIVTAYYNFLLNWKPSEEQDNIMLQQLGKDLDAANYAFCLSGRNDILLHKDKEFLDFLSKERKKSLTDESYQAQCAINGKVEFIARVHDKIKGIKGGKSETLLVSFNKPAYESYNRRNFYNSAISETVMRKYTEALNLLVSDNKHTVSFGDMTVIFWAMNDGASEMDLMSYFLSSSQSLDADGTDKMLVNMILDAKNGKIAHERIRDLDIIRDDVDFYVVGIKPNSSRLSIKFIDKRKYGDLLQNMAQFQIDVHVAGIKKLVSFWHITQAVLSPKSEQANIDPSLCASLLKAAMNNGPLPLQLLSDVIRRIKLDISYEGDEAGKKKKYIAINATRIGIIKAYLNRKNRILHKEEEIEVSLDKNNKNQAYLCGRLFAVLESVQQASVDGQLNRTIKDSYFASAASTPATIFARLFKLSQYHLKKIAANKKGLEVHFNKLLGEIMDNLQYEFPTRLSLQEQGKFIIGYYQQRQDFYNKDEVKEIDKAIEEE